MHISVINGGIDKIMKKIVDQLMIKAQNCRNNSQYYGEKAIWMAKAYEDAAEMIKILGEADEA